ncbi:MAG TPA: CdaR family protein [Bryobacteraceae bacterium]|nr:CdaR family protein [Bryobacteraceae bacterium]
MKLLQRIAWPIFALAAALGLWITFVGSPELVSSVPAVLAFRNMPADLEIASELPRRVHLDISGPSARLRSIAGSTMNVVVDLAEVRREGEHTFTIERRDVDLPAGVSLLHAVPSQLHLRFERRIELQIPVKAQFGTEPPAGYRVAKADVSPSTLTVVGAESRVRRVTQIETDPIDLTRVVGRSEFHVHAYLEDPQLRFLSPPDLQVSVALERTKH